MSCFCKQQLNAILNALKQLPLSQIAGLASPPSTLGMSATMAANISAAISANAMASATATASASFSASAVARLEAAAQMHAALGGGVMGSVSIGRMSVMIQSLNALLAPLLQELYALLAPIIDALMKLQQLASSLSSIQGMTGLNLVMPNVSFVPPPLPSFAALASAAASMMASASASANAALAANAAASAQASANAVMALRLQGAAMVMGFPLPGNITGLNSALGMLPALPVINPLGAMMAMIQQLIAALMSVLNGLGVNLFAPNAIALLQPILATVSQNLSATLAGNATATANIAGAASANATATAQALASINANAILNAAAQIPFPTIPDLQAAAASIGLGQNLGMLTGINPLRTTPCGGCVVPGWK
jgi:hypothetical protein